VCHFYQVNATRNNRGIAHENGGIESPNRHLKNKIDQQLRLRESRDFATIDDYQSFIESIVAKINRQGKTRFAQERVTLRPLPKRKTHDYSELYVKVTSSSTINVKRVIYTVPSRLIGAQLLVHIYDERLDIFHGHQCTLSLPRVYAPQSLRSRSIDYKHIIHSLAKKTTRLQVIPITWRYRAGWWFYFNLEKHHCIRCYRWSVQIYGGFTSTGSQLRLWR